MRFQAIPATASDIDAIFDALSDVSRAELRAAERSEETARAVSQVWRQEYGGYVILDEGQAVAVYGFMPCRGANTSWFVAARGFFEGTAATRFVRQGLRDHPSVPKGPLLSMTASPHPAARKWYRLLGFEIAADSGDAFLSRMAVVK